MIAVLNKKIYLILGFLFMGIGTLGYILPVLPGTIFMILAAYCFLNSSEKLYSRIVNHPNYGRPIKDYIENNRIPRATKNIILGSMWAATLLSAFILAPTMALSVVALLMAAIGSVVVLRASD